MYLSLKIKPKMSIETRARSTPKSQPASPRKFKIQTKVTNIGQPEEGQLWNQSSLSLTREVQPIHKIPNSIRFRPIEEQALKNTQFLTLQLRRDIKTNDGVRFPKSFRPEHFVKGLGGQGPSPASYKCSRFLQENNASAMASYNPESRQFSDNNMNFTSKGRSFTTFSNYHKSYVDHSKHKVYQPENLSGQPGPGKYNHSFINKHKKSSYSMRSPLKRFNQTVTLTPGPGAYGQVYGERTKSPNQKGTFQQSKRTYLTKFERFPSPHNYDIARFLDKEV